MLQHCGEFGWSPKGASEGRSRGTRAPKDLGPPSSHRRYRPSESSPTAFRWQGRAEFGPLSGKCRHALLRLFHLLLKKIFLCVPVPVGQGDVLVGARLWAAAGRELCWGELLGTAGYCFWGEGRVVGLPWESFCNKKMNLLCRAFPWKYSRGSQI